MTKEELHAYIADSAILGRWHYFGYHFRFHHRGEIQPFADSLVAALLTCDDAVPGFAKGMVDALAAISGRPDWDPHYWQLMQRLAEILVCRRLVECYPEAEIEWEDLAPRRRAAKKSPDFLVRLGDRTIGIEVKAPDLGAHRRTRNKNLMQLSERGILHSDHARGLQDVTLPRDNPVKDFLISAQAKFEVERGAGHGQLETLLVIVWDSYAYEAITALIGPTSGLLTDKSFARTADGKPLTFDAIGGVLVTQHLSVFITEAAEKSIPTSATHAFDYGRPGAEPHKVFIPNAAGLAPDTRLLECLQAIDPIPGTELGPVEFVQWLE